MIIVCWVDDCLFFGPDKDKIDDVIKELQDMGYTLTEEDSEKDVFTFLGVTINRYGNDIVLSQHNLIKKVLETTGWTECNPKKTPAALDPLGTNAKGKPFSEKWKYASVIGMLMYLCNNAHPEIQFAVHQCACFTHCPKQSHAEAVKKICRYLKGVLVRDEAEDRMHGLTFKKLEKEEELKLDCYVDADFAGLWNHEDDQDPVCVKSRTGYCMMFCGSPVHWVSKLQPCIALSTVESEYIALSRAMRDLLPMREFIQDLSSRIDIGVNPNTMLKSSIFEDNNGCISVATAPKLSPRTKHIGVRYHFFKDQIGEEKGIIIKKIVTDEQIADIFTKGLGEEKFQYLRSLLCGW